MHVTFWPSSGKAFLPRPGVVMPFTPRCSTLALPFFVIGALPSAVHAQEPAPPIQDNSFLVEEAYNQGPGIVQHIGTFARARLGDAWSFAFTQEWPVMTQRHQLAYTVPVARDAGSTGIADVAIHYRYQAGTLEGARTAFAPRLSLLLPTGSHERGLGSGGTGAQVNLPFSAELTPRVVMHSNAGATFTPAARNATGDEAATTDYLLAQSVIWLVRPKLNLMLEAAWTSTAEVRGEGRTMRSSETLIAPGLRGAIDFASGLQIVPGLAFPISLGPDAGEWGVFAYVSFEHAFARTR